MKAIKHKICFSYGFMDFTHGIVYEVEAIYIPEKKILVYIVDDNLFVSREEISEKSMMDKEIIEISDELVEKIEEYIKLREELTNALLKYVSGKPKWSKRCAETSYPPNMG